MSCSTDDEQHKIPQGKRKTLSAKSSLAPKISRKLKRLDSYHSTCSIKLETDGKQRPERNPCVSFLKSIKLLNFCPRKLSSFSSFESSVKESLGDSSEEVASVYF